MTISATELKQNLGKYLDLVALNDEEIVVTKNGKEYVTLSNPNKPAIDSLYKLSSIAKTACINNLDIKKLKEERLESKYGIRFDR